MHGMQKSGLAGVRRRGDGRRSAANRTLSIYLVSKIRFAPMAAGAARRAPGAAPTTEPF